jgi:hypothetical protein
MATVPFTPLVGETRDTGVRAGERNRVLLARRAEPCLKHNGPASGRLCEARRSGVADWNCLATPRRHVMLRLHSVRFGADPLRWDAWLSPLSMGFYRAQRNFQAPSLLECPQHSRTGPAQALTDKREVSGSTRARPTTSA